jgi:hypothetical protein
MASIGHGGKLEDPRAGLEPEKLEAGEPGVQQSCERRLDPPPQNGGSWTPGHDSSSRNEMLRAGNGVKTCARLEPGSPRTKKQNGS